MESFIWKMLNLGEITVLEGGSEGGGGLERKMALLKFLTSNLNVFRCFRLSFKIVQL